MKMSVYMGLIECCRLVKEQTAIIKGELFKATKTLAEFITASILNELYL
jgi:hypothetical protein